MQLRKFLWTTSEFYFKFESFLIRSLFRGGLPPGQSPLPAIASLDGCFRHNEDSPNILEFLKSHFLFAVPKHRRTVEKKRNRKFGWPQYVWKPLVPKTNILMCDNCGHDYEAGHLCSHCYKKIKQETEEMQTAIQNELQLNPNDKEVVVLYEGEARDNADEFWKGKRIVEMKKPRPAWFSSNLMEKTSSDKETTSKNFKPSDLA